MKQPKLGELLTEVRKAQGLTQEELAEKCNITVRTIQRIESGLVNPRLYTLKLISEILEYNFLELSTENTENDNTGKSVKVLSFKNKIVMIILGLALFILGALIIVKFTYDSGKVVGIDWKTDIDVLTNELPKGHFDFYSLNNHNEFESRLKRLKRKTKRLSDLDVAIALQQIISSLGDSHTRINWGKYLNDDKMLPLQLYWFKDGVHVLATSQKNEEILGKKLDAINGVSITAISQKISSIYVEDNKAVTKLKVPWLITKIEILEYFNVVKNGEIILSLTDSNNTKSKYVIEPEYLGNMNTVYLKTDSVPLCYRDKKTYFIDYELKEEGIYYLQYNHCWSKEIEERYGNGANAAFMPSFTEFEDRVLNNLNTKEFKKVVLDLRFNRGGNSYQGRQFIEKIEKIMEGNEQLQFYVVVGRVTAASAIMNAVDAMGIKRTVLIGEETSGSPNHYGERRNFVLPNSKLEVQYSTKYFKKVSGDVKSLIPDQYFEMSFKDYDKGFDLAFDWILKQ